MSSASSSTDGRVEGNAVAIIDQSTSSSTSSPSSVIDQVQQPTQDSSTSSSTTVDDAGSSFTEAPPPKKVTYIPFPATHEWQTVEEYHILPPGLWIQMDFDGKPRARLQPIKKEKEKKKEEEENEQKQKQEEDQQPAKQDEEGEVKQPAKEQKDEAPKTDDSNNNDNNTPSSNSNPTPSSSSVPSTTAASSSSVATALTPTFPPTLNSIVRRMKTLGSLLDPVYNDPSQAFLDARAPMPAKGQPIISIAPMVDVTDRHFRYLMRLISKHVVLYTPMLVDNALLRAPLAYPLYIEHLPIEHPVIAQLGGSQAATMVKAAKICEQQGFQQININVGCPAPSASGGSYGCILMNNPSFPHTVRAIVDAVKIPVTIKCRIGLNKEESFEFFEDFIQRCWKIGGVTHFIVHARKAVLNLKTQKNLTVPPLKYDFVHKLKAKYPELHIEINGGFDNWDTIESQIRDHNLQGVMLGRHAWKVPYSFIEVDRRFYGCTKTPPTRKEVMEQYIQYAERCVEENKQQWAEFEKKKKELEEIEAKEDEEKAAASENQPLSNSSESPSSSNESKPQYRPSELLRVPHLLDIRQLLRPIGYVYANEPGYKKFRVLFEESLLNKDDWDVRQIVTRAMTAVEPPPQREWEWPSKKVAPATSTDGESLCQPQAGGDVKELAAQMAMATIAPVVEPVRIPSTVSAIPSTDSSSSSSSNPAPADDPLPITSTLSAGRAHVQ